MCKSSTDPPLLYQKYPAKLLWDSICLPTTRRDEKKIDKKTTYIRIG